MNAFMAAVKKYCVYPKEKKSTSTCNATTRAGIITMHAAPTVFFVVCGLNEAWFELAELSVILTPHATKSMAIMRSGHMLF
jgi:hypothetical protein